MQSSIFAVVFLLFIASTRCENQQGINQLTTAAMPRTPEHTILLSAGSREPKPVDKIRLGYTVNRYDGETNEIIEMTILSEEMNSYIRSELLNIGAFGADMAAFLHHIKAESIWGELSSQEMKDRLRDVACRAQGLESCDW